MRSWGVIGVVLGILGGNAVALFFRRAGDSIRLDRVRVGDLFRGGNCFRGPTRPTKRRIWIRSSRCATSEPAFSGTDKTPICLNRCCELKSKWCTLKNQCPFG